MQQSPYISITLYRLLKNISLLEEIDEEKILDLSKNQWFLPLNWLSFAVDHNVSHILSRKLVSDFISKFVDKDMIIKDICNKIFINRQLIREGDNHIGLNDNQSGKIRQLI